MNESKRLIQIINAKYEYYGENSVIPQQGPYTLIAVQGDIIYLRYKNYLELTAIEAAMFNKAFKLKD